MAKREKEKDGIILIILRPAQLHEGLGPSSSSRRSLKVTVALVSRNAHPVRLRVAGASRTSDAVV